MNNALPPSDSEPGELRAIDLPPIEALPQLLELYRNRLRLLVQLRIDHRVKARIDASDVIQEAFTEAVSLYPKFLSDAKLTPYVWLASIAI